MKRIKNLGLAMVMALALTAVVGAAGASAAEFVSEKGSATLSSSEGATQSLKFSGVGTKCGAQPLEGTATTFPQNKVELTAKDSICEMFGTVPLKGNGCKFTYRPGKETSPGVFDGAFDIGPANCGPMQIGVPGAFCTVTIGAQSNLAASYQNIGSGKERSVQVTIKVANLKYAQTAGTCPKETLENGTWTGGWVIKGSDAFGRVGIHLEANGGQALPTKGIGIGSSWLYGSVPGLEAGSAPLSVVGQKGSIRHLIKTQVGTVECATDTFNSTLSASYQTQWSVQPEYSGCKVIGVAGAVKMNGCTYTFNVLNQPPVGSAYAGHMDIACPAGKAIEITAGASIIQCTITIPAQTTDSGGLTFTNESATTTIGLELSIKGIDYHAQKGEGAAACITGDYTTGTYTGSNTLVGS